ncbi:hypothetical protein J8F10_28910 [Gemmata sp. G18]|uniref:Uncharacterized protein n=1 Tax=Gemmata palustris TaxID=2822762 RepID=A0ABS5C009_9BACT|nr:hypothetical protein [Gemmata palustris]MBP3959284.1 hypothetical protein [Gemmata palustris]
MPRMPLVVALCLTAFAGTVLAQPDAPARPGAPVRKLLYPADPLDVPPALKPHVERLLDPDQKPVEPGAAKGSGVYLRVLSRRHALDGAKLKSGGWVGARPFVFLTVPDAARGRDLLGTLSAIGYDPEEILDIEKGVEKVAVVFAYPDTIRAGAPKDGKRPADWDRRVYPATWDNVFALADHLTADKDRWTVRPEGDAFVPTKLQFRSDKEAAFATGFPDVGKARVKATDYAALWETGGADWVYRQLIERLFGASEHFRGDGRTKLTLVGKRNPRVGFPEFLGPNAELKDLPAIAVVGLGAIRVGE